MATTDEPFFVHASLAPLLRLPDFIHRRIVFISERTPNRERWYGWLPHRLLRQFAFQQLHHCELARTVWREQNAEIFFLFEHKAMYAWPLYLVLLLKRRPCFFLVHGLQQLAARSWLHRLGLALCRTWVRLGEFYPIHLELGDAGLPPSRRFDPAKSLVIPHPHPKAELAAEPPRRTGPLRVGVVGMLRRDKPVARLLDLLQAGAARGEYELIVGTPFWQKETWLDALPVTLRDTHDDAAYDACLGEIDLLVADFRREDYEFRPSGVVIDAAMEGCFVLAPDYPRHPRGDRPAGLDRRDLRARRGGAGAGAAASRRRAHHPARFRSLARPSPDGDHRAALRGIFAQAGKRAKRARDVEPYCTGVGAEAAGTVAVVWPGAAVWLSSVLSRGSWKNSLLIISDAGGSGSA